MNLKISVLPKLLENVNVKKLTDALHQQELEVIFTNIGKEEGKDNFTYGVYVPNPLNNSMYLQLKASASNGNSLFVFYLRETEVDFVPSNSTEQIKKICKIEIGKNFNARDRDFSNLTFDIDELPITKTLSKSDREKEVKIWETYIKAFKAFYKNQEELLKIIDIEEPNKGVIDVKIEKEDWKKILISELEDLYPQFPLVSEKQNVFEFAYNNTLNNLIGEGENTENIDTQDVFESIKKTIKENFFKIVTNPVLVSRSFIKLNFYTQEQKLQVAQEIMQEVNNNFPEVNLEIANNFAVTIKLEHIKVLQSVISNKYPTLELSDAEGIFKYKITNPIQTVAEYCQNLLVRIRNSNNNYNIIPSQDYKQIFISKERAFLSFEDRNMLKENFKIDFVNTQQEISFPHKKNLPQIDGTVLTGNVYSYQGNQDFLKLKSEEIKNKIEGFWKLKTTYIFNTNFQEIQDNQLSTEARLVLYNEFGSHQKINVNKAEIRLMVSVSDYQNKSEKLKQILATQNIQVNEVENFNLSINQKLENEQELSFFIEKAIKKPLLSEYKKDIDINFKRQIIELEWKANYSNQQILQSISQILNNNDFEHFFKKDAKTEISQILTFKAELENQKISEFERKRQFTFTGKGSAFLLDVEQAYQFEHQRDIFSDDDLGTSVGQIDDWQKNKISISLMPKLLQSIKDNTEFVRNELNLADLNEWIGNFIKPTLSGDLTQNRRLQFAIEKVIYATQPHKINRKNKLTLFNSRLPEFIFDASQARPIKDEELKETENNFVAFNRLNPKQKEATLRALNAKDLFILQGPPGTGKTTVISEIIYQLLKRNPKTRILLTSQTHLAVDNALERLSGQSVVKPLRLGSNPDSFEEEGLKYFEGNIEAWIKAPTNGREAETTKNNPVFMWISNIINSSDTKNEDLQPILENWRNGLLNLGINEKELFKNKFKFNIVGATCSFTGHEKKFLEKLDIRNNGFDYVIFDEASKATPPELLIPLLAGKVAIIIGDHKQLPPLIEEDTFADKLKEIGEDKLAEEIEDAEVEKSQFEKLFRSAFVKNPSIITTLDTQFRMHEDIMQVINQFYQEEGGLFCGLPAEKLDIPDFNEKASRYHGITIGDSFLQPENHILWVDTTTLEQKLGTTFANEGEIKVIDQLLQLLKKSDGFKEMQDFFSKDDEKEIGLITFYGEQKKKLREVAKKHSDLLIRVNTVDKFQGMERNIIIISTVRNNEQGKIGFAEKLQRINVALSRAKRLLIVVGNIDHFANNKAGVTYYKEIKRILEEKGCIRTQKMLDDLIKNSK